MDRTTRLGILLAGAIAATAAIALDPPHDASQLYGCANCHVGHNSLGSSLTKEETNENLCQSCHVNAGDGDFGFAWSTPEQVQANPGASGSSHRWSGSATGRGANLPANANLSSHLATGNNLMCSTCHDPHNNQVGGNGGIQHIGAGAGEGSYSVGSVLLPIGTGAGNMKLEAVTATAAPKGYRVRVNAKDDGNTKLTYDVSHDAGKTWFAGGTVVPGGATPTVVNLDDGTNVRVSFTDAYGGYAKDDYYEFWIGYPMLQMSNADDAMCEQCHQNRVQTPTRVEGGDGTYVPNGTNKFHHPVNAPLAKTYDRTGAILDANGLVQTTSGENADGNATNDIRLDSASKVRCTSCHFVHNADSNSLTVDPR